jgi:hypothetical protein
MLLGRVSCTLVDKEGGIDPRAGILEFLDEFKVSDDRWYSDQSVCLEPNAPVRELLNVGRGMKGSRATVALRRQPANQPHKTQERQRT